jgi:prepilin-type N-terminal cleavage/methylation domain-containing protein
MRNQVNNVTGGRSSTAGARRQRAFTLMELLIVVALVAILAALLLPVASKLQESGNASKCATNQRNILATIFAYAADHDNNLPCYGDFSGVMKPWWEQLSPYLGGSDEKLALPGINMMRCPSAKDPTRFATYGVNYGYSAYAPFSYAGFPPTYSGSMKLSKIPGKTFLIGDCLDPSPGGGNAAIYSPLLAGGWVLDRDGDGDGIADSHSAFGADYNQFAPRHGKAGLCGFADGSVKNITVKQWQSNDEDLWGKFVY